MLVGQVSDCTTVLYVQDAESMQNPKVGTGQSLQCLELPSTKHEIRRALGTTMRS